jgi:hypothetical protein
MILKIFGQIVFSAKFIVSSLLRANLAAKKEPHPVKPEISNPQNLFD